MKAPFTVIVSILLCTTTLAQQADTSKQINSTQQVYGINLIMAVQ